MPARTTAARRSRTARTRPAISKSAKSAGEPHRGRLDREPQAGRPEDVLVELEAAKARRRGRRPSAGRGRRGGRAGDCGRAVSARRRRAREADHREGQRGCGEELPEAAARVLGVREAGRPEHVVVAAEEDGELHDDEGEERAASRRASAMPHSSGESRRGCPKPWPTERSRGRKRQGESGGEDEPRRRRSAAAGTPSVRPRQRLDELREGVRPR